MNPALIAPLALAGLLAGYPQRTVILRYPKAPPPRDTPARDTPAPDTVAQHPPAWDTVGRDTSSQPRRERGGLPPLAVGCVTAILLGALAARVHPGLALAAACWLAICAVPLAFIDIAVRRLPDHLTVPALAGTLVLLLLAAAVGGHWPYLLRAVLGGLALTAFYLLLVIISPSGMGLGDVKLAASLGTMLAWFGWRFLIAGGFAGFLLAGLYGIALLVTGRAHRKQQIPLGPFMIAAAFLVLLA